jgi:hypothetical protein
VHDRGGRGGGGLEARVHGIVQLEVGAGKWGLGLGRWSRGIFICGSSRSCIMGRAPASCKAQPSCLVGPPSLDRVVPNPACLG